MVTRKPASENSPIYPAADAVENPAAQVQAPSSDVDLMEPVLSRSDPALTGHDQTNGVQSSFESQQVQNQRFVPLPDPVPSGGVTNNSPSSLEQSQRILSDDIHKAVNMQNQGPNASHTGDLGIARSGTNPFKSKPVQGSSDARIASQTAYNGPSTAPETPAEPLSDNIQLELPARYTNPWQSALEEKQESNSAQTTPSIQNSGMSPSPRFELESQPLAFSSEDIVNIPSDINAQKEDRPGDEGKQAAPLQSNGPSDISGDWSLVGSGSISEPALIDLPIQETAEKRVDIPSDTAKEAATQDRRDVSASQSATLLKVSSPPPGRSKSRTNVNMSETYQIKIINWHDSNVANDPRKSPILVQNANGPCPLVALVNALILTTPADRPNTELVETLKSRERVSLKFLLDLVVDELMSFRHTESSIPLPDMSDLYSFLQGLHTGMNVNPRFIPPPELLSETDADESSTSPSDVVIAGTFEKTRDIELYSTFDIPLIHGWLPPKDDAAYKALKARACSYDDAQNLLFREEELEMKLSNSQTGLTEDELQLYQDVFAIKTFLFTTATQLTPLGLDVITKSIKPGGVSILFRNDHFSTLYRHPQTLRLFSLVTDAGFFTHDEVIWESLVDVKGELAEFFSGDFRPVGGTQPERAGASTRTQHRTSGVATATNEDGWQTVQNRRGHNDRPTESAPSVTSPVSQAEQEDRDLALALQLQEEEDERHRVELAHRRRESRSTPHLERQGLDGNRGPQSRGGSVLGPSRGSANSLPPPRGSSASQPARPGSQARNTRPLQQVRSLIPPRTHRPADDGLEEAPPSYEQAAKSTPYLPPTGHPSHPDSSPRTFDARRGTASSGRSNAVPSTPPRARQSVTTIASSSSSGGGGKDRDCNVM